MGASGPARAVERIETTARDFANMVMSDRKYVEIDREDGLMESQCYEIYTPFIPVGHLSFTVAMSRHRCGRLT